MKKTLALLAAVLCTLAASAATYTGKLTVKVNEYVSSQDGVVISIDANNDGTYNLWLNNFVLIQGEDVIPVGNIQLNNEAPVLAVGDFAALSVEKNINITDGDLPDADFWLGSTLGDVPIRMGAIFSDTVLRVHIDIDMTDTLGQVITVDFATADNTGGLVGDVNSDGVVDIDDVNSLVNIILKKS